MTSSTEAGTGSALMIHDQPRHPARAISDAHSPAQETDDERRDQHGDVPAAFPPSGSAPVAA